MELTPVKVKGKGGAQKKTWRPPAPQRTAKRPREEAEGDVAGDDRRQRRRFKSKRPAAPVEELPTEILENIILMSQNLNFLRSSLRIGYRFSSLSFLTELLKAAFGPTWQMWLGYHRARIPFEDYTRYSTIPGDPDFQVCRPRHELGYHLDCNDAEDRLITLRPHRAWSLPANGPTPP
jgi:hypothetical protein